MASSIFIRQQLQITALSGNHMQNSVSIRRHTNIECMLQPSDKQLGTIKSERYLGKENKKMESNHIQKRFDELKILTKEKDKLMSELKMLKEGAVTALLQKEEQIQKLKQSPDQWQFEDEKQQMQKQLNKMSRQIKDLKEENLELTNERQKSRNFFFQQLYSKEVTIDMHLQNIAKLEQTIQKCLLDNKQLQEQLRKQEQKSYNLEIQIQTMKMDFLNYKMDSNKREQTRSLSIEQIYDYQQQVKNHNKEIEELVIFYENKLNVIQNLYEQQINLKKTMETQQSDEEHDQVYDLFSTRSIYQPELLNLKFDIVRNLDNTWKNDDYSDIQSQTAQSLLNFNTVVPGKKQSRKISIRIDQGFKPIRFEENHEICSVNDEQLEEPNKDWQSMKKIWVAAGCGFVGGMATSYLVNKLLL